MTYYNFDVDINTPIRQQITVPTGEDFAVKVQLLKNGVKSKYIKRNAADAGTQAEANWGLPASHIADLIESTAYKVSLFGFGNDAFVTYFFKGSDVADSKSITFTCDRWNNSDEDGILTTTTMFRPSITFALDVVFIEKSKRCDGPDYNLDVMGNVSTKNLSTTALSATTAQFAAKQASYEMKERDVVGQAVLPGGMVTYVYNHNGMSVLSGNLCLKQDLSVKPNKGSASSGLFLGDYSKAIVAKDITVGDETITVLTIVNT